MKVKPIDKKVIILASLISIVAGILFCALKVDLLYILFTIIGAFIIVGGVLGLLKRNVLGGILSIAIGVLLIIGAWLFVEVLLIVNGVLLCVSGVYGIVISLMTRDFKNLVFDIAAKVDFPEANSPVIKINRFIFIYV